jgi:hypothetical protein
VLVPTARRGPDIPDVIKIVPNDVTATTVLPVPVTDDSADAVTLPFLGPSSSDTTTRPRCVERRRVVGKRFGYRRKARNRNAAI